MTRTVDGTAVFHEAIKTINDLRADNERLRAALTRIAHYGEPITLPLWMTIVD